MLLSVWGCRATDDLKGRPWPLSYLDSGQEEVRETDDNYALKKAMVWWTGMGALAVPAGIILLIMKIRLLGFSLVVFGGVMIGLAQVAGHKYAPVLAFLVLAAFFIWKWLKRRENLKMAEENDST